VERKLTVVTVETDGLRDYVLLPNGERYILGAVSVLKFIAETVPSQSAARRALDEFNKSGQVVVAIDLVRLPEILTYRRSRWAGVAIPLIPAPNRTTSPRNTEGSNMDAKAFENHLSFIERHITELETRTAAKRAIPASLIASLRKASISLPSFGDQSKNDAFYDLGQPKVDTVEDPGAYTPPANVTHPLGKSASFRILKANGDAAETILSQMAETATKIDSLEAAGRPFNAAKARADVHKVVGACERILANADLAEPYLAEEIQTLAKRASRIHGLFASARV
jgi:hypothetical protein